MSSSAGVPKRTDGKTVDTDVFRFLLHYPALRQIKGVSRGETTMQGGKGEGEANEKQKK